MAGRGRPKIAWSEDDRELFKRLCGIFCTRKECASVMGVSVDTLDRLIAENFPDTPNYPEAFAEFSGEGRTALRRAQFDAALKGNTAMLIFLGKNYLGQSDNGPRQAEQQPRTGGKLAAVRGGTKYAGMLANG